MVLTLRQLFNLLDDYPTYSYRRPCPAGTYGPNGFAKSVEECVPCKLGHYCSGPIGASDTSLG